MKNKKIENSEYELCVFCGKDTAYTKDIPVEKRHGYIEGAGQLCPECYRKIYGGKQGGYG